MNILIARIPEEGMHFDGDDPAEIMGLENDPFIKVQGDVVYSLYAQHVSEELVVRGKFAVDVALKCARCSEFFSTTVSDSDFLRAYPASKDADQIDITEDIREALLLNMPGFAVCSESCKGLCVQCGKNLNEGPCACEKSGGLDAWQALDNLNL
ncbi:MAG: DUF177 domain-containing protein [Kiritimatiellales bacterium]|nr:DUF177 domain-containing protein [Kiritimatiellales bacterium]